MSLSACIPMPGGRSKTPTASTSPTPPPDPYGALARLRQVQPSVARILLELLTLPWLALKGLSAAAGFLGRASADAWAGPAWRRDRAAALAGRESILTMIPLSYRRKKW